ncbi:PD-(D/E)XK motif protein [Actinomyces sp. HMSC065F11]|uniref:PD-(D/E)XK motif protein n=1 Tax=Actinomyces sp. HMSC065F11 TaxID=1739395 RepID=UPI0008A16D24|nr:PD-(D/E)XK motif protein [Actinomyces sp. HMSC065F11]OFR31481.1 hypothetical protein HMPREF2891_03095 [Actinomyces sp. HMSC065F11]
MNTPGEDLRSYLEKPFESPDDETVRAFRLECPGTGELVWVTFSPEAQRQLLIQISEELAVMSGALTKFIDRQTVWHTDRKTGRKARYVAFTCTRASLTSTFESLIVDFIRMLDGMETSAFETFEDVFLKWEELLQQDIRKVSFNTLVGLFGELVVLEYVAPNDPTLAVESWSGPENEGPDFKSASWNIEVKTTTATNYNRLHVSDPNQFVPSGGIPLYLARVALTTHPRGRTIHELRDHIIELGISNIDLAGKIQMVSAQILEDDTTRPLLVKDIGFYKVDETFPHIGDFGAPRVMEGVSNLQYDVELQYAYRLSNEEMTSVFLEPVRTNVEP